MKLKHFAIILFVIFSLPLHALDSMFGSQEQDDDVTVNNNRENDKYSTNKKTNNVPSFTYFNLHFLEAQIGYAGFIGASAEIDFYLGGFILDIGFDLKAGYEFYIAPTAGLSFVFAKDIRLQRLRQAAGGSTVTRRTKNYIYYKNWRWSKDYTGVALNMHLLDFGLKYIVRHVSYDEDYNNGSATVFGQNFTGVDYIEYLTKGPVYYFGYKFMAIRQKPGTLSETIVSLRGLIGTLDREATVYDWNTETAVATLSKTGETVYGIEAALDWHMVHFKLGYFDKQLYTSFGLRLAFQTGL